MKILLISNMYPSSKNPFYGIFVKKVFEYLQEKVDIDKVVIDRSTKNIPLKLYLYLWFIIKTWIKLIFNTYDIIYVHYAEHSLLSLLWNPFVKKSKLIINAHGDDLANISLINKLTRGVLMNSSLIVVPSKYYKDYIVKLHRLENINIFVSPSGGVDLNCFYPINNHKIIDNSTYTIGYASRLYYNKGWNTYLNAMKKLISKNKKINGLIIGGGPDFDLVKKYIAENNLSNNIKMTGAIPNNQLVYYFNQMDILVFPTEIDTESLGLVGLEAMACGIPVIASNVGGINEYLIDGYNGFFFKKGDSADLLKCIDKVLNKDILEKFSENALNTAKSFENNKVNNILYEKFKNIISFTN